MIGDVPSTPATVVWLAPRPPSDPDSQALAAWARAHGERLEAPREQTPPAIRVDMAVAGSVEDLLDRARDAIAARDRDGTEQATAAAESLLRAHPELPQAAWLMAEVERARSTRWRRIDPPDAEAADRAWLRAEALDGGRVAGIAEVASGPTTSRPARARLSLALHDEDQLWLDGRRVSAGPARDEPPDATSQTTTAQGTISGTNETGSSTLATVAGLHDLVVTTGDATVWAGWIDAPAGSSTAAIDAPGAVPCSRADVAHARAPRDPSEGPRAAGVQCEAWIAAAPGPAAGTLRIARCAADRCEPMIEWRPASAWASAPLPVAAEDARVHRDRWPAWATWALAGAGVALAAGAVVVAAGAFQTAPATTRFVTGGLKTQ